jgi:hypothetical protein
MTPQYAMNPLWLPGGQDIPIDGTHGRLPSRSAIIGAVLSSRATRASRVENKQAGHHILINVASRQFLGSNPGGRGGRRPGTRFR